VNIVSLEALEVYNYQNTVDNGNKLIQVIINAKEECQNELYQVQNEIYKLNAEFNEKYSLLLALKVELPIFSELKDELIKLIEQEFKFKSKLKTL